MSAEITSSERFAPLPASYASKPSEAEEALAAEWRAERTFERVLAARRAAQPFVFWEGPPTANGRPGIHHVLARTLKDVICRHQTMRGRRVERKAGWDTHGLPVELEVERALGISGKPAIESLARDPATGLQGIARFNDECRKSVWKYKDEWERLSERIGYWLDYARPYVTYEPEYVDSVWYLLARMHEKGLIYRGKRVLPYCGRCGTSLSSHELGQPGVYRDVVDPSVVLRFVVVDAQSSETARESLLAWTTTPWTLPSNFALAVHPEREYVRARVLSTKHHPLAVAGEIVWVVRERAHAVLGKAGEDYEELGSKRGRDLVGRRYQPLFEARGPFDDPGAWQPDEARIHHVVAGDFVTVEDGTGIVHQAPYGADDWETARANRLPLPVAVGREGRFVFDVGAVASGTFFKDADDALMDDLKARGLLFAKAREPHSYPHCWRCSTPLFYFPTPAWFIRTTALKQRMLELNRRIRWVPEEVGTSRFGEWLENNVDWNISRDRYWGTPLPFWVCDECGAERAVESVAHLRRLTEKHPLKAEPPDICGLAVSSSANAYDPHRPWVDWTVFACPECGGVMKRTAAVLDCWFDSGAMPFAQHGWPHAAGSEAKVREQFPADFICEGLDQTRGWFYTLHAIGAFVTQWKPELGDTPAYRACLVNGLVLDKDGVKMSKRLGNVVDPWQAVAEHGADAVRWYLVASAAPWLPKRFDPKALAAVRHGFFATLSNSYKFFSEYARLDRFDPLDARIPAVADRSEIDRWIVSRTHSLAADVRARLDGLDVAGAARAIESFVVDDLSNWYIRRNRRRLWKGETGPDKLAAFASLHGALRTVALTLAPIAPFLAELLWRRLEPTLGSVHAALAPDPVEPERSDELERSMEVVQRVVVMGRSLRERAGIKVRQPLRAMHVRSSDARALDLLAGRFASEQVLDELNVKAWGSLGADDGSTCRLTGKANFRALGPRLGTRMKSAAAAIGALDATSLARLRNGGTASVTLDGVVIELGPGDVQVNVESTGGLDVETDGTFVAWLDTALDEALVAEGLARELVSRVNALRKESGLAVEERIRLSLEPGDAESAACLDRHGEFIARETLASAIDVAVRDLARRAPASVRWELAPGRFVVCAIERAAAL